MNDWTNLLMNNAESILNAGSVTELTDMLVDMGIELNEEEKRMLSGKGAVPLEDEALDQIAGGAINLEKAGVGLRFLLNMIGLEEGNSELLQKLLNMGQSLGPEIREQGEKIIGR